MLKICYLLNCAFNKSKIEEESIVIN